MDNYSAIYWIWTQLSNLTELINGKISFVTIAGTLRASYLMKYVRQERQTCVVLKKLYMES